MTNKKNIFSKNFHAKTGLKQKGSVINFSVALSKSTELRNIRQVSGAELRFAPVQWSFQQVPVSSGLKFAQVFLRETVESENFEISKSAAASSGSESEIWRASSVPHQTGQVPSGSLPGTTTGGGGNQTSLHLVPHRCTHVTPHPGVQRRFSDACVRLRHHLGVEACDVTGLL